MDQKNLATDYILLAQNFLELADGLRTGKMALKDIPWGNIIEFAAREYEKNEKQANHVIGLYRELFGKGAEYEDAEIAAAALGILARHMMLFAVDNDTDMKSYNCRIQYYLNRRKTEAWHKLHGEDDKAYFNGKGVVYTAVIGSFDEIQEPAYITPGLDHVLFTDNPAVTSDVWQVRYIRDKEGLDNVRLSKKIKIMGHEYLPEYDYSVWIDGNMQPIGNLREYIEKYHISEPVLCYNHRINDCVYQELTSCINLKKDDADVMGRQIERYRKEGYPEHNGLVEAGILVRALHDPRVKRTMETWWSEVQSGSRRDQLSFNYACWKNDLVYDSTDLNIYSSPYIKIHMHI